MPRIDFKLLDRVYILKLICSAQMTFSAFVTLLYFYLTILQIWTSRVDRRHNIVAYKWSIFAVTIVDFCLGTLLAVAANMRGKRRKRRLIVWIILETLFIPSCIFIAMQLYFRIHSSKVSLSTDIHYLRMSIVQVLFMLCHYIAVVYVIDFLVSGRKRKGYDPRIRPDNVSEPTYPQITTTESRHIRMGESFLIPHPSTTQMADKTDKDKKKKSVISKEEEEEKEMATTSSQK